MKAKKSGEHYWLAGNVTGGGGGGRRGGEWNTTKYHGETREVESLEPVGGEENNQIIIMKRCHTSCHTTNQLTLMNHKK